MIKSKRNIIILIVVLIVIISVILVIINLFSNTSIEVNEKYDYDININNQNKEGYSIESGNVKVKTFSVEKTDDIWYLNFIVENSFNQEVDLSEKYVLIIYDQDDNLLQYISNNALGKVPANFSQKNIMRLNYDGSKITKLELKAK